MAGGRCGCLHLTPSLRKDCIKGTRVWNSWLHVALKTTLGGNGTALRSYAAEMEEVLQSLPAHEEQILRPGETVAALYFLAAPMVGFPDEGYRNRGNVFHGASSRPHDIPLFR